MPRSDPIRAAATRSIDRLEAAGNDPVIISSLRTLIRQNIQLKITASGHYFACRRLREQMQKIGLAPDG